MLKGIDISHHNRISVLSHAINLNDFAFVIMKATEGATFVDPCFKIYNKEINQNIIKGYYHFARPDINPNPSVEAYHFCRTVGELGEHALIALDWEAKALKYPVTWALLWCKTVEQYYGKKPLIYCSESYVKNLSLLKKNNNGLWVAKYSSKIPVTKPYRTYALWQYTSRPYDKDVFNGSRKQLLKYCARQHGTPNYKGNVL